VNKEKRIFHQKNLLISNPSPLGFTQAENLCKGHVQSPVNHLKASFNPEGLSLRPAAFSCQKKDLGTYTHVLVIERSPLYTSHFARGYTGWAFRHQLPTIQAEDQDQLSS